MKKQTLFSRSTKNAFLIPLLVVSMLILGIVIYAVSNETEIRSKAANNGKCMLPTKSGFSGKLTCRTGFTRTGNLCCPISTSRTTPAPTQ